MKPAVILVKNMVCHRCVMTVDTILNRIEIPVAKVLLGEIHLVGDLGPLQKELLADELRDVGFELIDNHTGGLIEKIKQLSIQKARNEVPEKESRMNLSGYLAARLNYEYTYLSSLFSDVEGRTIENFFIEQRIEKAKELLVYGQLTLSQIALDLDYSSTAHLSAQFRKITGLTPSHFKKVGIEKRRSLDKV